MVRGQAQTASRAWHSISIISSPAPLIIVLQPSTTLSVQLSDVETVVVQSRADPHTAQKNASHNPPKARRSVLQRRLQLGMQMPGAVASLRMCT